MILQVDGAPVLLRITPLWFGVLGGTMVHPHAETESESPNLRFLTLPTLLTGCGTEGCGCGHVLSQLPRGHGKNHFIEHVGSTLHRNATSGSTRFLYQMRLMSPVH